MKNYLFIAIAMLVVLACSLFSPSVEEAPAATATLVSVVPVLATDTPLPTDTPAPTDTPTSEPTPVPTRIVFPQQWNGTYTYSGTGAVQRISLLIEKVSGTKFQGKMIWQPFGNSRGAILRMNGEFITDFGDEREQMKWKNLDDYEQGDMAGTWLKWTETEIIDGRNYTVNGWYYAHIRENGTMVAVYFYNKDEIVADRGAFVLEQVLP